MKHFSWRSMVALAAVTLFSLSLLLPLHSFPASANIGADTVYARDAVRQAPSLAVVFLLPMSVLLLLGSRTSGPVRLVVLLASPLLLAGASLVVYLESEVAMAAAKMPFPFFPLPFLFTGSIIGAGCWAFLAANGAVSILWFAAVRGATRGLFPSMAEVRVRA